MKKRNVVVGSGLCPYTVRFRVEDGAALDIVDRIKGLKKEIRKGGRLFDNYPQSLFDEIHSWAEVDSTYFKEEGARASIVIAQCVIKSFCEGDVRCALTYKMGEKNGGATLALERSVREWGIEHFYDYFEDGKGDNQIDVIIESASLNKTARVYQSSKTAFKYKCDLKKIEKAMGEKADVLLFNRAAQTAKDSAKELIGRGGVVGFRIHNFSRHAGAKEHIDMLDYSNYIFISDPAKEPSVAKGLMKHYGVYTLKDVAKKFLEIDEKKRIVVVPPVSSDICPSDACENFRFFMTGEEDCVEVSFPKDNEAAKKHINTKRGSIFPPDSSRARTAWLNGSCIALVCKDWKGKAPFELKDNFPASYKDLELFANYATQIAYTEFLDENFTPTGSWVV